MLFSSNPAVQLFVSVEKSPRKTVYFQPYQNLTCMYKSKTGMLGGKPFQRQTKHVPRTALAFQYLRSFYILLTTVIENQDDTETYAKVEPKRSVHESVLPDKIESEYHYKTWNEQTNKPSPLYIRIINHLLRL
jgi:hypothetical protein